MANKESTGMCYPMSVTASYDDLIRGINAVIDTKDTENVIRELLEKWNSCQFENLRLKEKLSEFQKNNKALESKIDSLRKSLANKIIADNSEKNKNVKLLDTITEEISGQTSEMSSETTSTSSSNKSSPVKRNRSFSDPTPKPNNDTKSEEKDKQKRMTTFASLKSVKVKVFNIIQSTPKLRSSGNLLSEPISQNQRIGVLLQQVYEDRKHKFVTKTAIFYKKCGVCNKKIDLLSKCYACDMCFGLCHGECKDKLPVPCIPFKKHKNSVGDRFGLMIEDFAPECPQFRPRVPAIIVHICREVEKRGLTVEGIYRRNASNEDNVLELKKRLVKPKEGAVSLDQYNIHVLTNVLKRFLMEMSEPLITHVLWRDFSRVCDPDNSNEFCDLIISIMDEMPVSNCDSLAFLMIHLKKIIKHSDVNNMTEKDIIKLFSPSIVGYSSDNPNVREEFESQKRIMTALLNVDDYIYHQFLIEVEKSYKLEMESPTSIRRQTGRRRTNISITTGPLPKNANSLYPMF